MKEPWVVFYDNQSGEELCAYTVRGTFSGERKATKEMLAYEQGIPTTQISTKTEMRK